jgi:glucose-1-phosphate cytidylyltransferase
MFEHTPMQRLAADGQLMAYRHESFWQCVDTLRENTSCRRFGKVGKRPGILELIE